MFKGLINEQIEKMVTTIAKNSSYCIVMLCFDRQMTIFSSLDIKMNKSYDEWRTDVVFRLCLRYSIILLFAQAYTILSQLILCEIMNPISSEEEPTKIPNRWPKITSIDANLHSESLSTTSRTRVSLTNVWAFYNK